MDIRDSIINILNYDNHPVAEGMLKWELKEKGFSEEEITSGVSHLMNQNVIRWVAFRGYALGGRPE